MNATDLFTQIRSEANSHQSSSFIGTTKELKTSFPKHFISPIVYCRKKVNAFEEYCINTAKGDRNVHKKP
jgi:hypothetical protein